VSAHREPFNPGRMVGVSLRERAGGTASAPRSSYPRVHTPQRPNTPKAARAGQSQSRVCTTDMQRASSGWLRAAVHARSAHTASHPATFEAASCKLLIDGKLVASKASNALPRSTSRLQLLTLTLVCMITQATEWVDVLNPATQEVVARVPCTTPAEFDWAVTSAKDAFGGWAATPVIQRTRVMLKLQVCGSCVVSVYRRACWGAR